MTTFESSVTIYAVTAIVFILVIGIVTIVNKLKEIIDRQYANWEQLRKIETHANFLANISQQLDNIEDNTLDESIGLPAICKKLDDLRIVTPELQGVLNDLAINSKGHYNELQQLREEIYKQ